MRICPIVQKPLCSKCQVTSCMWNTELTQYENGCIFGSPLSDKSVAEAKGESLLGMERIKKVSNERIQKVLLLYKYLEYIERTGYVKIPMDLVEEKLLNKIKVILSRYPFDYGAPKYWNISNLLAAASSERYENFYSEMKVSRNILLHRLFNMDQAQQSKLLEIKRQIGINLRNNNLI